MKIKIKRESIVEYDIDIEDKTALEALNKIKAKIDPSLVYDSGCRSSVCGSCAIRVNAREVLACSYHVKEDDLLEPLSNMPVIRDLSVDMDKAYGFNSKAKAYLSSIVNDISVSNEDAKLNELQSSCILCASCYSACPVYSVNGEFLGPFALTRVWRYVSDKREQNPKEKIDVIQTNGIWDCTLCNECTLVCPQDISSKADIEKLRAKSTVYGYMDPSFSNFGGGFDGSPVF